MFASTATHIIRSGHEFATPTTFHSPNRNRGEPGACRALAFEPRVRACFEIKALSPQEGWLPFKDLATQRSEQERVRGEVKTMCDRLLGISIHLQVTQGLECLLPTQEDQTVACLQHRVGPGNDLPALPLLTHSPHQQHLNTEPCSNIKFSQ